MSNAGYYTRKTKTAPRVHRDIERPDWTAVINGLIKAGYPKNQIALAANCTREMVYSMLRGNTPPWDVGAAVLRLAAHAAEPKPCAKSQ
jgi:hypothetical protein